MLASLDLWDGVAATAHSHKCTNVILAFICRQVIELYSCLNPVAGTFYTCTHHTIHMYRVYN